MIRLGLCAQSDTTYVLVDESYSQGAGKDWKREPHSSALKKDR